MGSSFPYFILSIIPQACEREAVPAQKTQNGVVVARSMPVQAFQPRKLPQVAKKLSDLSAFRALENAKTVYG